MTHVFAPGMSRVRSWARTTLMVLGLAILPSLAFGQGSDPAKPGADKAGDAKLAEKDKAKPAEGEGPTTEVFIDQNSKDALVVYDPMTYVGVPVRDEDLSRLLRMATGQENLDSAFLKTYIDFYAVMLSNRANINAVLKPPANLNKDVARAMEKAKNALLDPLTRAQSNLNKPEAKVAAANFLVAYNRALFESRLVKLLDNNLISRIDAMIILGMAGSKESSALDLYIAQIKKPKQVVWVKSWAARGLTKATQEGKSSIETGHAIQAAEALIALLEDEENKLPYPVQVRAIECLGALRLATARTANGKLDVASVVMKFVADPAVKLEVRAYAAWALGMMRVPAQTSPYNFTLLGHEVGKLAVEIGQAIVEEYDDAAGFDAVKKQIAKPLAFDQDKDEATRLTSLLLFQVMPCLDGQDGVSESGLIKSTHVSLNGGAKRFVSDLEAKAKAVTREAYELLRAGGAGQLARRNSLDDMVGELGDFLAKNPAKDRTLMPNGPPIPEVAGAPR